MQYLMESAEDLRTRARRSLHIAEHMIKETYPVVNDPKLILAVAGDIYAAVMNSMTSVLMEKKKEFSDDFQSRFEAFKSIAPACGFREEDNALIADMETLMAAHRQSPVEFPRKDLFIICDDKYDIKSISVDDMKNYLCRAKLFLEKAELVAVKGRPEHE